MAIATLPRTDTTVRIVFTEDPDVRRKNKADWGWILHRDAHASKGADVLEVAPLNRAQRAAAQDATGICSAGLARAEGAIKSVNGKRDAESIEAWLEQCPDVPTFLLGIFVGAITNGVDPQEAQRAFFRSRQESRRAPDDEDAAES